MEFRCLKTLFYINYELSIDHDPYHGVNTVLRVKNTDIHKYGLINGPYIINFDDLNIIESEKYNFAYNLISGYDSLEDQICSLRLQADILEKLNQIKNISVEVSFKLDKLTNKVSYKLVNYKGHDFFRKLIKSNLDKFCKEKKVKFYIWGDEFK
jgi:hypothetical protein